MNAVEPVQAIVDRLVRDCRTAAARVGTLVA
jgi:hypothetical protein